MRLDLGIIKMTMKRNKILLAASLLSLVLTSCIPLIRRKSNSESTIDSSISEISTSQSEEVSTSSSKTNESSSISEEESSEESIFSEESSELGSSEEILSSSDSSVQSEEQSLSEEKAYTVIETLAKRMPAEFEPVSMVKMCYPNNMPLSVYKTISEDNKLLILTNPDEKGNSRISEAQSEFTTAGVNMSNVTFIDMDLGDDYSYWVRDFSPFYVFNNKGLSIVDFTYNRPYRVEQNAVPSKLSTYFNMNYSKMGITHTGGNLMQDGRGTAFSDDLVVSENNNSKTKVLSQMEQYTGTDNYVITIDPQGDYIAHIDCWAKIVAPDKIIVARLPQSDSRYSYYEQVANELANTKCAYGYNYRIYRIDEQGGDTIAPYTNSLIANKHVYVPLGENKADNQKALATYQLALPGYTIHGMEGFSFDEDLCFLNTDALHCRTHEVPDQNMLFIDSREVLHDEVNPSDEYLVKANIVSYANAALDKVTIHYSVNDGAYQEQSMIRYQNTTNYTFAFTNLNSGDDVKYYIEATDKQTNYNVDPSCGNLDPHHFVVK